MTLVKNKAHWEAREFKNGWRFYLRIGDTGHILSGVVFPDKKSLEKLLDKGSVLFIHMKKKGGKK